MILGVLSAQAMPVGQLYCKSYGIVPDEVFYLGKLNEGLGEVSAAVLKLSNRSRGANGPMADRAAKLADEMANLFGVLLMFAHSRSIDLGAAFQSKWGRYLQDESQRQP